MNRMTLASVAALMVLASSAQALASMSLSSPQPVEPGCPTTGSAAGSNGKDNPESSAGMPSLAGVPTLASATTATTPASVTIAVTPSSATTTTIPSSATTTPTTGTARTTSGTNGSSPSERRKTEPVERWDELTRRMEELGGRKASQVQRAADESSGARKRGLERIERFLEIAHRMKPNRFARYR
jgi:hypothetical protein